MVLTIVAIPSRIWQSTRRRVFHTETARLFPILTSVGFEGHCGCSGTPWTGPRRGPSEPWPRIYAKIASKIETDPKTRATYLVVGWLCNLKRHPTMASLILGMGQSRRALVKALTPLQLINNSPLKIPAKAFCEEFVLSTWRWSYSVHIKQQGTLSLVCRLLRGAPLER